MFYSCSQRTLEIYKCTLINDYIFMRHSLKCVLKYTKKSIIIMFESGEHVGGGRLMMVSSNISLPLNCLHHPSTRYCKCATSFNETLCVLLSLTYMSEIQVYAKMNYKLKLPNQIILQNWTFLWKLLKNNFLKRHFWRKIYLKNVFFSSFLEYNTYALRWNILYLWRYQGPQTKKNFNPWILKIRQYILDCIPNEPCAISSILNH